jgi:D-tyrosyl-tRNA(Tyr) deacylase
MKVVIQRVLDASVSIDGKIHQRIGHGFLVLLGIGKEDSEIDTQYIVQKTVGLRVFADGDGKMNRSLAEVGGELLLVSQFTLFASTKKGNRPSYIDAALPEIAKELYLKAVQAFELQLGHKVKTGVFGADMKISLVNDGPVTILIDSKNKG